MMTRTEFYEAVRRDVTGMVSGPLGMIAQVRVTISMFCTRITMFSNMPKPMPRAKASMVTVSRLSENTIA